MRNWLVLALPLTLVACGGPASTADGTIHGTLTSSGGDGPRNNVGASVHAGRFTHQTFAGELTEQDPGFSQREGTPHDRYPVQLQAGDRIRVAMWSTEFDTYLYLLGPNGQELIADDDGSGTFNSFFELQVDAAGTYTVVATAYGSESRGHYAVFIQSSDHELDPPLNVGDYQNEGEGEISGEVPTRDPPVVDRVMNERLSANDPTEPDGTHYRLFPVDLQAGDTVYVMMRSSDFDSYLDLLAPDGTSIASSDDNEIAGGLNSYVTYTANQAGTYQVRASSFSPGSEGSFEVLIGRHPSGTPAPEP